MDFKSRILIMPGLGNSGELHWQTLWEKKNPGFKRVQQNNWDEPVCEDWIKTLDDEILRSGTTDVILVAHSLACCTIGYWSLKYKRTIKGALLVAPSDTEAESYPPGTTGFKPMPLTKLLFHSIVVMSSDDFYVSNERGKIFCDAWGSGLVTIGNKGHINASSGLGNWPEGLALLKQLDY
jgi:predicted alpha/beta hydrolase family esterase